MGEIVICIDVEKNKTNAKNVNVQDQWIKRRAVNAGRCYEMGRIDENFEKREI